MYYISLLQIYFIYTLHRYTLLVTVSRQNPLSLAHSQSVDRGFPECLPKGVPKGLPNGFSEGFLKGLLKRPPNWGEFAQNWAQFPDIPGDRLGDHRETLRAPPRDI